MTIEDFSNPIEKIAFAISDSIYNSALIVLTSTIHPDSNYEKAIKFAYAGSSTADQSTMKDKPKIVIDANEISYFQESVITTSESYPSSRNTLKTTIIHTKKGEVYYANERAEEIKSLIEKAKEEQVSKIVEAVSSFMKSNNTI